MTRLLTTGYETGDIAENGTTTLASNGVLAAVSSTPTPRAGAYCLKCSSTTTTFTLGTFKLFSLAASKTDLWVRFAVLFHPVQTFEWVFALVLDSASAAQNCLTWDTTSNLIRARLGATTAGTLLGTSATPLPSDTWHVVDWRTQITSTTAGTTEVWLDGTRIINFSGDNTNTANANVQSVELGHIGPSVASSSGIYLAFDDIAINDTAGSSNNGRAGDGRVVLLTPTGAGSNTGLSRGGTDSGANWSQVEELPPSMTDYVFHATAGTRDTYAMSDLPTNVASVNTTEVVVLAQNSDAGAGSLALTVKSGGTTNEGTAQALGTTAAYIRQLYETDPNTSAAWTSSAVNALEAGVTVR
jgi:hypothetical protein